MGAAIKSQGPALGMQTELQVMFAGVLTQYPACEVLAAMAKVLAVLGEEEHRNKPGCVASIIHGRLAAGLGRVLKGEV